MENSDTFFYFDGQKVIGPHSRNEIQEMFSAKLITAETQICTANDHGWKPLSSFPKLLEQEKKIADRIIVGTDSKTSDINIPEKGAKVEGVEQTEENEDEDSEGKFTPIRQVRALLNDLWEAQRESIIANIRNEKLDEQYERKRKQHLEIKEQIKSQVLSYWRKSRVLNDWIRDLTKENSEGRWDYRKKLAKGKAEENFERVIDWLDKDGLAESPGCYAFRNGQEYIYIGMTEGTLKQRLTDHRDKIYWNEATHIRIIIPYRKDKALALERLLILKYQPGKNRTEGNSLEGSPADECLDFIGKEIDQLLTDG